MIYIALVHYPVLNRRGETIVSAVTNLDIHDIARVSATYGIAGYFIITPVEEQQALVHDLTAHWLKGGSPNSDRKTALSLVHVVSSIEEARSRIVKVSGALPRMIATSARMREKCISWRSLRKDIDEDKQCSTPVLLLFGTASGLSDQVFGQVDGTLEPIEPGREYNHLSVRSAVAITLDRLLGRSFA